MLPLQVTKINMSVFHVIFCLISASESIFKKYFQRVIFKKGVQQSQYLYLKQLQNYFYLYTIVDNLER